MPFTEQEERFIAAAIPVLDATEEFMRAEHHLARLSALAMDTAKELGASLHRTYELMQEALQRAGYESDSAVAQTISDAYDEARNA